MIIIDYQNMPLDTIIYDKLGNHERREYFDNNEKRFELENIIQLGERKTKKLDNKIEKDQKTVDSFVPDVLSTGGVLACVSFITSFLNEIGHLSLSGMIAGGVSITSILGYEYYIYLKYEKARKRLPGYESANAYLKEYLKRKKEALKELQENKTKNIPVKERNVFKIQSVDYKEELENLKRILCICHNLGKEREEQEELRLISKIN